ncbi:hypothetical protein PM082_005416 [Marasmius tenuissimus]|nr:hypothetical protein PM082_005416 [Marasmius tenuissimus]
MSQYLQAIAPNIQECHCESSVKEEMRNLACYRHSSREETLDYIEEEGNKKAQDWLADKRRWRFNLVRHFWTKIRGVDLLK